MTKFAMTSLMSTAQDTGKYLKVGMTYPLKNVEIELTNLDADYDTRRKRPGIMEANNRV